MKKWNFDGMRLWKACLLWIMAFTSAFSGCVLCLNEEGQLLFKWKQGFLKDVDNSTSNWNASDSTPCLWRGVTCTQGSVSALDFSPLPFCRLVGEIQALTFAKFGNLTLLNVGNTSLNGTFPQDIVNCSKLVYLNLSNTYISGKVPGNLTKLQQLQVLDLTYAALVGTMVVKFDELQKLRVLRLGGNFFEGQMPESIPSLTKLEELSLSHNNWNGTLPLSLFQIPNLKALWLGSDLDVMDKVQWPNMTLWEGLEDLRLHGVNFPQASFPTGVFKLTKLKTLHLERCNIMGPIPSLENLTHLEFLNLGNNSLSGHIPDMFGSIPNLERIWLYSNQLIGTLPNSLLHLRRLWEFIVFYNGLSGNMANVSNDLANLRGSLTHVDLGFNNYTGEIPTNLDNLVLLTFLDLSENNFSGAIPASLGTMSQLTYLAVHNCNLVGEIPRNLGNLSQLTHLDLAYNNFGGEIPASLGNLSQLTYLSLQVCNLIGEIPRHIGNMSQMTSLDLSQNNLSGSIPLEISKLGQLSELRLYQNKLTGAIPYDLGRNALLQRVDLGYNFLEGSIPPYLCWGNNVTLQFLGLYQNRLTGTIPKTYGNCTNLGVVRLDGNHLKGPVPASLWGGAHLVRMQMSANNLSGRIDASIGNAKSLSILYLQNNRLSGPIPIEIGQTNLVKFQVDSNELNGTLTPLLGNLSRLTQLVLGAKSFHGVIPASLSKCSQLFQLDFSRNHLDGTIPDELVNLKLLSTLDVSENNLTGTIPRGLFSMVNLQVLNVAFNNLSGVIPNQGNGPGFVNVNFTGNPNLCMEGSCGIDSSGVGLVDKRNKKQVWIVVVGVFGVVAFGLLLLFIMVLRHCNKSTAKGALHSSSEDKRSWTLTSFHNKVYHEDEISALDEDNLIGTRGSGKVYKVTLSNGDIVAVKKLWNVKKDEGNSDHGFGTKLTTLANIRHRHIVKLLCNCTKGKSNLLVYEYMPNGSLGDLLHKPKANTLSWQNRYKIALGVALGLEYLHHDCSPQILHRDIKSNNILVDLEYEAHLADFGVARMVDLEASHDLSSIVGSLGYIPPEYSFGMQVTEKIDIYSFGVVLLELVTRNRATNPLVGWNLVEWVHNKVVTLDESCEVLDPNCGMSSRSEMVQVLRIAMACSSSMPTSRPSMCEVAKMLQDVALSLA